MSSHDLSSRCPYTDPGYCLTVVATVMLHQGPDFVLFALKKSLEHIATQLVAASPMRARFTGLASRLEALLEPSDPEVRALRRLN
jgi:hypothetical protein